LDKIVLVKLGGSVITDKSRPFTYRSNVVASLAKVMASAKERIVLVHGGGSFGHTVAMEHGLSATHSRSTAAGVALTRAAMYKLNSLVCSSLIRAGMSPYPFSPFDLLANTERSFRLRWLRYLLESGLIPTTFGDVVPQPAGFRILSGDIIAEQLATILHPRMCIFAMDERGIYKNMHRKVLLRDLSSSDLGSIELQDVADATGGIRLKLKVALAIAAKGVEVDFVSGLEPRNFSRALRGLDFTGTRVR
jgi:isopentenyl phosphate kinase